jgi:hypothetical protein
MAISISVIAIAASLALLIILLGVVGWQRKSLGDLNNDIKKYSGQISGTQDVNKILTIQNQLKSLPALDAQKPVATRLFDYISELTPNQAGLATFKIDFTQNTLELGGTADSLTTVNQFVDTLKFTTYTTSSNSTATKVFSNVVLGSFGLGQSGGSGASFDITASFDPTIFSSASSVQLSVPNIISTRSEVEQPQNLFTGTTNSQGK